MQKQGGPCSNISARMTLAAYLFITKPLPIPYRNVEHLLHIFAHGATTDFTEDGGVTADSDV